MRLGLLRHGIAEDDAPSGADYDRRLTREGRAALDGHLARVATFWTPSVILYSPLVRTRQTTEHVQQHFPGVTAVASDLIPAGRFDAILRLCAEHSDPLVVGHEPTLGMLLARIIGAPDGATPFERGGFALVNLDRVPTTRPGRLLAFLPPLLA